MPHPNPNSNLLTPHRIISNVVIFPQSPHTRALKLVLRKIFHSTNTSVSFWPRAFSSSLSCSLSFSPLREGHGTYQPHQPMYATTQFTPQHETTQRSDTHTHTNGQSTDSCLSVCHHCWQVGQGWTLHGRFQQSSPPNLSQGKHKFVRSLSVFIHVSQLVQSGTARGITVPSSRRHLTSDLHIITVTVA